MANPGKAPRNLIEGNPALIVIDNPNTAIAAEQTGFGPTDCHIRKRRY